METKLDDILKLEEELRLAEMQVDRAALDRFFADELMVTAPIGVVVDKAAVMDEIERAQTARVELYDKEDINARLFGDTAITSYRVHARAEHEGVKFDRLYRITNVWLRRDGRWQVVARHTAMIEQPKAEQCGA